MHTMGDAVITIHGGASKRQRKMVATLAERTGTDPAVLQAMARVPREIFVADELREEAALDCALPIGEGQRTESPSLVARTLELMALGPNDKLLEIGTGSGYTAAVAAQLAREVYTIELRDNLARAASCFLGRLGYRSVHVQQGEGALGWPEAGPFDAISVTFPEPSLLRPLLGQLALGGRLVMATGESGGADALLRVTRTSDGFVENSVSRSRPGPALARKACGFGASSARLDSRTCA